MNIFFCKQQILLRPPYIQKARNPTFLRQKYDVRLPSFKVEKIRFLNLMSHLKFIIFFLLFYSFPTNLHLAYFFLSKAILSKTCQKKSEMSCRTNFEQPLQHFTNTFFFQKGIVFKKSFAYVKISISCFNLSKFYQKIFKTQMIQSLRRHFNER